MNPEDPDGIRIALETKVDALTFRVGDLESAARCREVQERAADAATLGYVIGIIVGFLAAMSFWRSGALDA